MTLKSYTAEEYRVLAEDGPFCLLDNPRKNFYTSRRKSSNNQQYEVLMGVNHITAGIDDFMPPDNSAEATAQYGMTTTVQVSWHGVVDSDSIIPCLPDEYTAWSQGVSGYEFNRTALALEIGTKTSNWNSKPDWWVEQTLRNAAVWWAPRFIKYNLPLRYVTSRTEVNAMLKRGEAVGLTDHYVLDPGNRSDPGLHNGVNTFPRQRLLDYIAEEINRIVAPALPPGRTPISFFLGATGPDVFQWQQSLVRLGYQTAPSTETFGEATDVATKKFQLQNGLDADGKVGPASQSTMERCLSLLRNRIAGTNRYRTAIEVSRRAYPDGTQTVYLVDGVSMVDGISATALDGARLLVKGGSDNLPAGVPAEIARLKPIKVVAVGGGITDKALHAAQVAAGLTTQG